MSAPGAFGAIQPVTNLPVTIIGGYLGAGKTTLLNRILTGATGNGLRWAAIISGP